ncbi:hypothetical protein Gotri_007145 [Gossypium trilobum]|uniref:Cytochrome P450 n=1 Tax=Gossypium trilobum TaxID=34281 RepID=A0A7J9EF39_9ROSI|nr:hypothetical protein [Gossypium trilobum]
MIPTLPLNIDRPHDKVAQILGRSNGTFFYRGLWFTNTSFLATSDPENVHYILSSNSSVYLKGPEWLKQFDIFGEALFNSDGEAWKRHGKALHSFYNHPQIRQSLSKVLHQRIEEALVEVLEYVCRQEMVVNLQDLFARHAFDIGCIMGMGFNHGVLSIEFPENRFHKATNAAMEAAFYCYVMPDSLWKLQSWLQIGKEKKRSDNRPDRPTPKDSLMRDNIIQFLFGSEALCETLRLYPPVRFEFRSCTKPDFLPSGHRVDRSTRVLIGIHAMGRMESLWGEDCYELKPER